MGFHSFLPPCMWQLTFSLSLKTVTNSTLFLGATRALKTPVLNMTGDHSPHVEATVAFNGRLQPNKCTWMKIQVLNF